MIPKNHPRRRSLEERHKIEEGFLKGIVTATGMIAQGRGEAFDYLLGEKTNSEARKEIEAAAALLVLAKKPVISVNGNIAALCAKEVALLAKAIPAQIEVNLFYRTEKRVKLIENKFAKLGVKALGSRPNRKVPGLHSKRGLVHGAGIYAADTVLVMIEDGDRTEFLKRMGKKVIAVDLNPLSRTSRMASVTIVDNVTRCIPLLAKRVKALKKMPQRALTEKAKFNNHKSLKIMQAVVRKGARNE